jgi:chromosome segregation ATPase
MKRYTLTECYDLLQVDPKTFRGWLSKAGIEPLPSKADPRVKYLTEEQMRFLADAHERNLERAKQQEVIPPSTAKLLRASKKLDEQVEALEQQMTGFERRLPSLYEETMEAIRQAEEQQHQKLETLRQTTDLQWRGQDGQVQQIAANLATHSEHQESLQQQTAATLQELQQTAQKLIDQQHQQFDAFQHMQQAIETQLAQQARERDDALQALNQEVAADLATFTQQLNQIENTLQQVNTHLKANAITAQGAQRRIDTQEQRLEALSQELQQETQARQALEQRLAALERAAKEKPSRRSQT